MNQFQLPRRRDSPLFAPDFKWPDKTLRGATITSTFVGEAYMAYGVAGVVGFGLVLGILCSLWNRIGTISGHRTLLLLSVAGFFWVTVAIRSYS